MSTSVNVVPSVPIVLCDPKDRFGATDRDARLAPAMLLTSDDGTDKVTYPRSTRLIPHVTTDDNGSVVIDNKAYIDTFAAVVRDTALSKAVLVHNNNVGTSSATTSSSVAVRSHVVAGLGTYTGIYAYDSAAQAAHSYSYSPNEAAKNYPGSVHENRLKAMAQLAEAETQMFVIDMQNSSDVNLSTCDNNTDNNSDNNFTVVTDSNAHEKVPGTKPANIRLVRGDLGNGIVVDNVGQVTVNANDVTMTNLVTLLRDMAMSSFADTEKFGPLNRKHLIMGSWMQLALAVYTCVRQHVVNSTVTLALCSKAVSETNTFASLVRDTIDAKK